ncbi:MAG TPA: hypothetical protein VIY56_00230 [Vicinamibacterales bacterium]
MSKFLPIPKQFVLAAVFALAATTMLATVAFAQSPPAPPARYVGNVRVDGVNATVGTVVEARIGNAACGSSSVFTSGSESRYALDAPALDPATSPGCGADGAVVTFYVGGRQANETATWINYQLNTVNLTVTSAAPATPGTTPVATPRPPTTGTGPSDGSSAPSMELLLVAAAIGLTGAGVAVGARARVRKP